MNYLVRIVRPFREHLLSGFSWNVLSTITLQGSVLVSTIIVARVLGLASFGVYSILVSTVMMIAAVAQGGTGLVATKYVAEFLASEPARAGRVLNMCRIFTMSTGAFATAVVFASAGLLSSTILGKPELTPLVRLVSAAIFFQVSVSYQIGALQGFGAFKELSRAGMLAGLGQIGFAGIGVWLGQTTGALLGFVLASAFRTVLCGYMLRAVCQSNGIPKSNLIERQDCELMWRFALPTALAGFVTIPCLWLVTVLVARQPGGLSLVAMFSVAHQVRLAVLQLPSLLNAVSFSVLSRLKGLNHAIRFRGIFWSNLVVNLGFSTLIVSILTFAAEPVLLVYGRDFTGGHWVLILLLASVVPEMLAMSFYQLIQSAGRMWYSLFLIAIPRDLIYLVLAAVLLPLHGVTAAAAAYLVAHTVGLISTLLAAYRFAPVALWPYGRH